MNFSEQVKLIRTKALLSQESFASEIKVSVATINRWEHGKALPNITAMKRIREFCKVNEIPFDAVETIWLQERGSF